MVGVFKFLLDSEKKDKLPANKMGRFFSFKNKKKEEKMADLNKSKPEKVKIVFSDGKTKVIDMNDFSAPEIKEKLVNLLDQVISRVEKSKIGCYRT